MATFDLDEFLYASPKPSYPGDLPVHNHLYGAWERKQAVYMLSRYSFSSNGHNVTPPDGSQLRAFTERIVEGGTKAGSPKHISHMAHINVTVPWAQHWVQPLAPW